MRAISTYWHTLRHLRPVQFYGRAWFKMMKPRPDLSSTPPLRQIAGVWASSARRHPSMLDSGRFRFLNEEYELRGPDSWDDLSIEKLWRYNLHYFDDLNAEGSDTRTDWHRKLLVRWIYENPPGRGTAWEPYPTSLRIVNWIKWSLAGNSLSSDCLHSLAVQVRWLARRMEFHLLGNHLFANAKALVFAGLFFAGTEAERWLDKGFRILQREVTEQILGDGGQFERSTMYHCLALEDMLDLYNVTRTYQDVIPERWTALVADWLEVVGKMRHWLAVMCHPDGEISFFNDSAFGISPSPAELETYAGRLGFPPLSDLSDGITHLSESGYIRIQRGPLIAILDLAPVGPDYLPGHAHADTLSFELSLFGRRLLVNSGTSCYGDSSERMRQRGTAAHNTVVLDGEDSSEVWGGFRVARRARPSDLKILHRDEFISISCSHDGYRWLAGKPRHTRTWLFTGHELQIEDRISGRISQATARFHLHPSLTVVEDSMIPGEISMIQLQFPTSKRICISVEGAVLSKEIASWHPKFGVSEPNICLVAELNALELHTRISYESLN